MSYHSRMIPLALLVALPAFAAENMELLAGAPDSAIVNEVVELRPAAGHHFNEEAPNRCGGARAFEVLPRRWRCRLEKPGKAAVLASVCDDAKTFCKQARFELAVTGSGKPAASAPTLAKPKGSHGAPAGFLTDPAAALARAQAQGKPLLVHFFAIWCPPCNELGEHTYPSAEFQAAAEDFVLVALDADAATSFAWKARFKVGGYPTVLAADASLRELGRVVGTRSGAGMAKFMGEMKALKDKPVELALKDAAKDPVAALRVAAWRAERGEFAEVERLLGERKDPAARLVLLNAREEGARRAGDEAGRVKAAESLLAEFPDDANYARWVGLVAAADKARGAALRQSVRSSVEVWTASPALGETWFSPADLLAEEADFVATVESTAAAKPYWLKAAAAQEARAATSPLGAAARGANFGRAYALGQAGEHARAAALLESLVKAYPDEFSFHYEYASALKELGQYAKAYPYARSAAERGYGDNWLRAMRLKASLELELGRPAEAAKTVDSALSEAVLPATSDVRSYRYVTELRKLRGAIAKKL